MNEPDVCVVCEYRIMPKLGYMNGGWLCLTCGFCFCDRCVKGHECPSPDSRPFESPNPYYLDGQLARMFDNLVKATQRYDLYEMVHTAEAFAHVAWLTLEGENGYDTSE